MKTTSHTRRIRRHARVRSRIVGTAERPRLSVYRSSKHLYAQLIDDDAEKTLIGLSDAPLGKKKMTKTERATALGEALAKAAIERKIKRVVFDRGGYAYHGRTKALADGARKGGLQF